MSASLNHERPDASHTVSLQRQRYQNVFESAPVALLEVDFSGVGPMLEHFEPGAPLEIDDDRIPALLERIRILSANSAAAELLGARDASDLLASPSPIRSTSGYLWLDVLHGIREGCERFERELTVSTLDGRQVDVLTAFRGPASVDQPGVIVVSLTGLERFAEYHDQLHERRLLEAVGRLASRVAHDLNNCLTVIGGYSGLLIETLPPSDPTLQDVRSIATSASAAERFTGQLMAFARPDRWQAEPVDLNARIRSVAATLRGGVEAAVELDLALADGLWEVDVDPCCIDELLRTLATNAREAMPGGGRLTLSTSNLHVGPGGLASWPAPAGDYAAVKMTDTGYGMDRETRQRSFEPFFTTKDHEHPGLGLSVVYGIVRQAGGLIRSRSTPGAGTTFEILFPRGS